MQMNPKPEEELKQPSTDAELIEQKLARYREQPLLNIYYQRKGKLEGSSEGSDLPQNLPCVP